MAKVRLQASILPTGGLPRDAITNTIFLDTDEVATDPNYGSLATDLAVIYQGLGANLMPAGVGNVTVRAYDMADDSPRRVRAEATRAIAGTGGPGPREVALCLSFRAERNLPRHRGRVFMGPIRSSLMGERPTNTLEPAIAQFANGISGLGGVNVQWVVYSRRDNTYRTVRQWWHDDEWDTQRSRGLKSTRRVSGNVNG